MSTIRSAQKGEPNHYQSRDLRVVAVELPAVVIYNFATFETQPNPVLVFDGKGNLYGTYQQLYSCLLGCGAIFQLTSTGGNWAETVLANFLGGGNGDEPMAGAILDHQGNLYGTAAKGGNNWGIAFELESSGGKWNGIMLHNFCSINDCADGLTPVAGLVVDVNGALYGATSAGGTGCRSCGLVFKLAHTKYGWKGTALYNFRGGSDGASPTQSLILDARGNLYGTTPSQGNAGFGTVFEVVQ